MYPPFQVPDAQLFAESGGCISSAKFYYFGWVADLFNREHRHKLCCVFSILISEPNFSVIFEDTLYFQHVYDSRRLSDLRKDKQDTVRSSEELNLQTLRDGAGVQGSVDTVEVQGSVDTVEVQGSVDTAAPPGALDSPGAIYQKPMIQLRYESNVSRPFCPTSGTLYD